MIKWGASKHFITKDAVKLHYQIRGAGKKVCMLVHGFGEGSFVWFDLARRIPSGYAIIGIDLRGHGDSSWEQNARYDVESHVTDVEAVLQAAGWDDITLIGHSMGAEIALQVASRVENKVSRIIIVDYAPDLDPEASAEIYDNFARSLRSFQTMGEYKAYLEETRIFIAQPAASYMAMSSLRHRNGSYYIKCDPQLLDAIGFRGSSEARWAQLAGIVCEVLLVRGSASSVLTKKIFEKMSSILPASQNIEIPRAGHGVMVDNPEDFASAVSQFLTSTS